MSEDGGYRGVAAGIKNSFVRVKYFGESCNSLDARATERAATSFPIARC
jgi:hypothetical protein